jgi:integrase
VIDPVLFDEQSAQGRWSAAKRSAIPGSFSADTMAYDHHKGAWSANQRKTFRSVVLNHVLPNIGQRQTADLTPGDYAAVIEPHWMEGNKNSISGRLLQFLPAIVQHAIATDDEGRFPHGINPAIGLKARLRERHGRPVEHRKAIKWQQAPDLYDALLAHPDDPRAMAMAFMFTTRAPRAAEVHSMRRGEIKGDEWHIPAGVTGRMKNKRDGRVARIIPLSGEALRILSIVLPSGWEGDPAALVFPMRDKAHGMNDVLRELGYDIQPHGTRTTCKSWGLDNLMHPRDIQAIELEQDRAIGDSASEAYRDTSMVGHRRILANRFAAFLRRVLYVGPACVPDQFATAA